MTFILQWVGGIIRSAADLIYPRRCATPGCGEVCATEPGHLCWDCRGDIALLHAPFCERCGLPVAGRVDHRFVCHQCEERNPAFDSARSAARFEGPVRDAIHAFKYNGALWLESDLTDLLESAFRTHFGAESPEVIAPVPLHRARMRDRGYNQAGLLAHRLARRLGLSCDPSLLRRVRDTGSQTKLTAAGRLSNTKGAFQTRRPRAVAGKGVLLVDDVMTTGATLSECARALKRAGAARVLALSVARG